MMRLAGVCALLYGASALDSLNGALAADSDCNDGSCALNLLARPEVTSSQGAYLTNKESKPLFWTELEVSESEIEAKLRAAFEEEEPFKQLGSVKSVASWLKPFLAEEVFGGEGRQVLIPWPEEDDDQLGHGGWVAYSRRQVCHITAMSFFGATTPGFDAGLFRLMKMCPSEGDFRKAFSTLLAACAADPSLAEGQQGPLLVVSKAKRAPSVEEVWQKAQAENVGLSSAGLRVCDYDTGASDAFEGVDAVPRKGCEQRLENAAGVDFMTGGLPGQATQDISASWFGGYLFYAKACGLGGGQDERLSVYFPEVTVLTYFLSQHWEFPQLRQPAWILGARNFFKGLDGTARFDGPMALDPELPLAGDLVDVELAGKIYKISSSRPFVFFMSESQAFFDETQVNLHLARRNRLPAQRDMEGKWAFEKQVRAWYRSMALTSYDQAVQPALKQLVSSLGAGPWLAGLWWGDSQLGFLAVWLGQALAASTWGQELPLDYYVYADFTENPGNQCYVLPEGACKTCLERCPPFPDSAYWMPDKAYFEGKPCVPDSSVCGAKGISDIVAAYGSKSVAEVWKEIQTKVAEGPMSANVFDILLASA